MKNKVKTILITGCAGFLGRNLIKYLNGISNLNYKIVGIDVKKNDYKNKNFIFFKCSILNLNKLEAIIKNFKPDIVIHLAATTSLDLNNLNLYKSNHVGSKNLIKILLKSKKPIRLIYTSTMLVNQLDHNSRLGYKPNSHYGVSKTIVEKYIKSLNGDKLQWCILRPVTIWGDGLDNHFKSFLLLISKKLYFNIKNQKTYKSFGYIKNSVFQISKLMNTTSFNFHRKIYYLADYEPIELNSWADKISSIFHRKKIKNIRLNIILLKCLAKFGDIIVKLSFHNFYMQSRRLKNLTTNFIVKNQKLEKITGKLPWSLDQASKNFVNEYKKNLRK